MNQSFAIVCSWFGNPDYGDGNRAKRLFEFLESRGNHVEIYTTYFTRPFSLDENEPMPDGPESSEDSSENHIHRFRMEDARDEVFQLLSRKLKNTTNSEDRCYSPLSLTEEGLYYKNSPGSRELVEALEQSQSKFDAIFFIGFNAKILYECSRFAREKVIYLPDLRKTNIAKLDYVARSFYGAGGFIFQTPNEQELATKIFGPSILSHSAIGYLPFLTKKGKAKGPLHLASGGRYVLHFSDPENPQGNAFTLELYRKYRKKPTAGEKLRLVVIGSSFPLAGEEGILFFPLTEKSDPSSYFERASAVIIPESLETKVDILFQAFSNSRPVICTGRNRELYAYFLAAGSPGFGVDTLDDCVISLEQIASSTTEELVRLGKSGRDFIQKIEEEYRFETAIEKALNFTNEPRPGVNSPAHFRLRVHQILPTLSSGDAISNQAIYLRRIMREMGIESKILVENREALVSSECEYYSRLAVAPEDGLIYHHSIGTGLTSEVSRHTGPRFLIYHNITPPDFFLPYNKAFAGILKKGIIDLGRLASTFYFGVGDSAFNRKDLDKKGFSSTEVLPILVDPSRWAVPADRRIMEELDDGRKNIIFVGRLAPNKKQEDLIEMFFHLRRDFPASRLILVGDGSGNAPYVHLLYERIRRYGLSDQVIITGKVTESQLHAYYRSADLFVSTSEHEGFGVPLIESMWFDIPVIAYAAGAVPETMRGSGVVFTDKSDFAELARVAGVILEDEAIRSEILEGQKKTRQYYSPKNLVPVYKDLIQRLFLTPAHESGQLQTPGEKTGPRIAFVVRRAGVEVNGGSDRYCLDLALKMKDYWNIDILTTCALDPASKDNFYPEGEEEIDGVKIHRFPVDRPSRFRQNQTGENPHLLEMGKGSPGHARKWVSQQGPASSALIRHLRLSRDDYDAFVFFSYKSAVTYYGLPIVQEKSFLVPASTGEEALELPLWESFFSKVGEFFFLTEEEQKDLSERFPSIQGRGILVGTGLNPPGQEDPIRFSNQHAIQDPYILYLDDIDERGAIPVAANFIRFRSENAVRMKLIFAGTPQVLLPTHPDIITTGHISEETIRDAISGATVVIIPLPRDNPPFSVLEAWNRDRPILVDGHSRTMTELCRRNSGGLWYKSYEEFQESLLYFLDHPDFAKGVSEKIRKTYDWNLVTKKIRSAVHTIL